MNEVLKIKGKPGAASGPRAMSRVLRLFEVLARQEDGLSLSDLAAGLEEPKTTLLNSLRGLEQEGYLNSEGTLYRLGPRAFRLAALISSGWSMTRTLRGYLRELAREAGETALLSVLDSATGRVVNIDVVESTQQVRFVAKVGLGGPLYATASGRVLLAFQPPEDLDDYLARGDREKLTPRTVIDAMKLREQIGEIRKSHVFASIGEIHADGVAIAAPVFGPDGRCIAALSVALPMSRLGEREDRLKATVRKIAAEASGEGFADPRA